MDKTSTSFEKLISYAYNETELQDTVMVQKAIDSNGKVASAYREILDVLGMLDAIEEEPSTQLVNRIMAKA